MDWHQGDFIELAQREKIPTVVFPAAGELNGRSLVMGAGAALNVKKKFPRVDVALGVYIAYRREIDGLIGDYYIEAAPMINTRGFFGDENDNPVITVVALQVKRDVKDLAEWDLTVQSLTHLREYLDDRKAKGEDARAVLSCPLIGLAGFRKREDELKAMIEGILKDTDVSVCTV